MWKMIKMIINDKIPKDFYFAFGMYSLPKSNAFKKSFYETSLNGKLK